MGKQKSFWLLFLILIIAGGLRLYHLKELPPGLYPDEAMDGTNAQEALATGQFKVFYPENNGREGLFMNIQAGFLRVIGQNEPWVLRLPSAIFGILTVLGLYFLGKELFSKKVGLLSAFFLATSFWHINFSRISFRAIMAPFFLVWAVYLFLRALRENGSGKNTQSTLYSIFAGIIYGLGFYSYIAYRTTPLLFLLFIPFFGKQKGFWKTTLIFIAATTVVALPIGLYFLHNPADFFGRTTQVSVMSSPTPLKDLGLNLLKTAGMFNFMGDWNWRHNFAGRPELFWPVGLLLWFGAGLGIYHAYKKIFHGEEKGHAMPSVLLFGWLFLSALPVVMSDEGLPHALRSILFLPALMLLAAWGGVWLYHQILKLADASHDPRRLRKMLNISVWIILPLLTLEAATTYFILWGKNPNTPGAFDQKYVDIAHEMNKLPNDVPKYVVVKAGGVLVKGIPMPAQTVMFITDTYTNQGQTLKNTHYVTDESLVPQGATEFTLK